MDQKGHVAESTAKRDGRDAKARRIAGADCPLLLLPCIRPPLPSQSGIDNCKSYNSGPGWVYVYSYREPSVQKPRQASKSKYAQQSIYSGPLSYQLSNRKRIDAMGLEERNVPCSLGLLLCICTHGAATRLHLHGNLKRILGLSMDWSRRRRPHCCPSLGGVLAYWRWRGKTARRPHQSRFCL